MRLAFALHEGLVDVVAIDEVLNEGNDRRRHFHRLYQVVAAVEVVLRFVGTVRGMDRHPFVLALRILPVAEDHEKTRRLLTEIETIAFRLLAKELQRQGTRMEAGPAIAAVENAPGTRGVERRGAGNNVDRSPAIARPTMLDGRLFENDAERQALADLVGDAHRRILFQAHEDCFTRNEGGIAARQAAARRRPVGPATACLLGAMPPRAFSGAQGDRQPLIGIQSGGPAAYISLV